MYNKESKIETNWNHLLFANFSLPLSLSESIVVTMKDTQTHKANAQAAKKDLCANKLVG